MHCRSGGIEVACGCSGYGSGRGAAGKVMDEWQLNAIVKK